MCAYTEDRWTELVQAVDSLRRQTVPSLEIILAVDHNPELAERARARFADVRVVDNSQMRGVGGTRNSGWRAARGDVVAFLDDDAIAAPDWVERLLAQYRDPNVAGAGGHVEPRWQSRRPGWFPDEFKWVVGCTYRGMPERISQVRNLHGCNMSFRRSTLAALGGFRIGYSCDETELCIRLQRRWPEQVLVYDPAIRVEHQVTARRATWRYFCSRSYFEGGSKAVVSWLVGSQDALSNEKDYTLRTLPAGIVRSLVDMGTRRDWSGAGRAAAIVLGLVCTTSGYVAGRLAARKAALKRGWVASSEPEAAV